MVLKRVPAPLTLRLGSEHDHVVIQPGAILAQLDVLVLGALDVQLEAARRKRVQEGRELLLLVGRAKQHQHALAHVLARGHGGQAGQGQEGQHGHRCLHHA